MSTNHHDDLSGIVATEAKSRQAQALEAALTRKDGIRIITDLALFGWRVVVPNGPAHEEWMAARRKETEDDLNARRLRPAAAAVGTGGALLMAPGGVPGADTPVPPLVVGDGSGAGDGDSGEGMVAGLLPPD